MTDETCGHEHSLWAGEPGYRADTRRFWVVVREGFCPQEAGDPWGHPIRLAPGTHLRYDQRDYDPRYYLGGWDRFCVLDGPSAGRCVFLTNANAWGPIEEDLLFAIQPIDEPKVATAADGSRRVEFSGRAEPAKRTWLDLGDHRGDLPADAFRLDASGGGYEAVGESHRRDEIAGIVGGSRREPIKWVAWGELRHEADNPYDASAVAVLIEGTRVGYLARHDAAAFAPVLDRIAAAGLRAFARADIFGGWERGDGDTGHYSVTIYCGPPEKQVALVERWLP